MIGERRILAKTTIYIILIIFTVFTAFPYFWMVLTSFRYRDDIFSTGLRLFSKPLTLENYLVVFSRSVIPKSFFNSVVILAGTVILQISTSALAAYSLARGKFPGVRLLILVFLGTMMIPEEVILLPLYLVIRTMHLLDTRIGTILALSPWGLTVYILIGFFRTIPYELEEAALINGANKLQIFRLIIIPISKPAIAAVIVFLSVAVWGHIIIPWTIIQTEGLLTVPLALKSFQRTYTMEYNLILAGATLASIPILFVFVSLKRYFIQGLVMGSLKE